MIGSHSVKFMTSTIASLIAVLLLAAAAANGEEVADKTDKKVPTLGDPHRSDGSYTLVWQDEFGGTRLDRKKWQAVDDTRTGKYGHGNGESQVYRDTEGDTFQVSNGILSITAHHVPGKKYPLRDKFQGPIKGQVENLDFTSAKLTTEKLAAFTYEFITIERTSECMFLCDKPRGLE